MFFADLNFDGIVPNFGTKIREAILPYVFLSERLIQFVFRSSSDSVMTNW